MTLHWSGVGAAPLMSPRQDETSEPLLYAGRMAGPYRCKDATRGQNDDPVTFRGLKLFGVRITDGSIRKSASMGNLSHYNGSSSSGNLLSGFNNGNTDLDSPGDTPDHNNGGAGDGYGSEDFVAGSGSSRERKKGVPWTEEEHRMFLLGLQKLGKAQSINNPLTIPTLEEELEECESMDSANSNTADLPVDQTPVPLDGSQLLYPVMFPAYVSPLIPVAIPYWPGPGSSQDQSSGKTESHEVLKPTAIHSKSPINVDDLVGMSKLTLGESIGDGATTSLKLAGGLSRQSAFHASNPGPRSANIDSGHNPIHAL
nr:transcription factor MYBS3-like [Tanacetum cinerariifolium]